MFLHQIPQIQESHRLKQSFLEGGNDNQATENTSRIDRSERRKAKPDRASDELTNSP